MPAEHRGKDVVICIAIGGDVQEQVRPLITGYIAQNAKENISIEEWDGDKLAALIQSSFLREDLLPEHPGRTFVGRSPCLTSRMFRIGISRV